MMQATTEKIKLLPAYKKLNNTNRYTIVTGGRGSAKSFHIALKVLHQTYKPGRVILYTRYVMGTAQDSIIPEFKQKIDMLNCENHFYITKKDIINKITGSRILFRGINTSSGNQTAKLKSIQGLTDWICDESDEMPLEQEFDKIDDSIRTKGVKNNVMLVLNPSDTEHWIYKRWFQSGQIDGVTYIHTTYQQNKENLDESFLRKVEKTKKDNPKKYKKEYLGEWQGVADLIFENGYEVYEQEPENIDWKYFGGDFGFDDPTTRIKVIKKGRKLYLKESFWRSNVSNKEIADDIKAQNHQKDLHIFDSAEPKSIKELQFLKCKVIAAKKGPDSINYGINKIKDFELFIHKDSLNLQNEFNQYTWQRDLKTGEVLKNSKGHRIPVDKNNHGIDAVRYVVTYFYFG